MAETIFPEAAIISDATRNVDKGWEEEKGTCAVSVAWPFHVKGEGCDWVGGRCHRDKTAEKRDESGLPDVAEWLSDLTLA